MPCLNHDTQIVLAGSKVICCHSVLHKYMQYYHPRKTFGLWRREGPWLVAVGGMNSISSPLQLWRSGEEGGHTCSSSSTILVVPTSTLPFAKSQCSHGNLHLAAPGAVTSPGVSAPCSPLVSLPTLLQFFIKPSPEHLFLSRYFTSAPNISNLQLIDVPQ